MVHVEDLERFVEKVVREDNIQKDRVVLGTYDFMTFESIVTYMKELLGSSSNILYGDSNRPNFYIDMTKAEQLGYESMPIREVLKKLCTEYIQHNKQVEIE